MLSIYMRPSLESTFEKGCGSVGRSAKKANRVIEGFGKLPML